MNKGITDKKSFPVCLKLSKRTMQNLSESIVLQSIEDLWEESGDERRGSFAFFLGKGFHICSDLAGMTIVDRRTLLLLITEALKPVNMPEAVYEIQSVDRENVMPC